MTSHQYRCTSELEYIELEFWGAWRPETIRVVWEYDSRSVCSEPVKWNPEAVRDQGAAGVLVLQRKPEISLDVSQRQGAEQLSGPKWCKYSIESVEPNSNGDHGLATVNYDIAPCVLQGIGSHELDLVCKPISESISRALIGIKLTLVSAEMERSPATNEDAAVAPWLRNCSFVDSAMAEVPLSRVTKNELICIHFSAAWCPPCQRFLPKLMRFYDYLQIMGKSFEVVYVSSDYSREDMARYMREKGMPWVALRYDDPAAEAMRKQFGVEVIPVFVVTTPAGAQVSRGRKEIEVASAGAQTSAMLYDQWRSTAMKL